MLLAGAIPRFPGRDHLAEVSWPSRESIGLLRLASSERAEQDGEQAEQRLVDKGQRIGNDQIDQEQREQEEEELRIPHPRCQTLHEPEPRALSFWLHGNPSYIMSSAPSQAQRPAMLGKVTSSALLGYLACGGSCFGAKDGKGS